MSRLKSSKIFIKRGEKLYSLMWANVSHDGTVMIGFPFYGKEQVEIVIDEELGEIRPPNVITDVFVGRNKISFHPSGQYKLETRMGRTAHSIDRVTVEGPRLADISDPRRMIEFRLPKNLLLSNEQATEKDIVLDATSAPSRPLRCYVFCMSIVKLGEFIDREQNFVWGFVHALESKTHAWAWTLCELNNDKEYPERFFIHLIGKVKWGQPAI